MRHLIVGFGQIGKLINSLLEETWIINSLLEDTVYEVDHIDSKYGSSIRFERYDFMHICIPYSEGFKSSVEEYIDRHKPEYVIIHSTVKPGTTDSIRFDKKIYSPVNGRHDNGFLEDVKRYIKYFSIPTGSEWADDFKDKIRTSFNLMLRFVNDSKSLEFAKVNCTNYTGYNIIYEKWLYDYCQKNGLDYDFIYRQWGNMYNGGVKTEWKRPIYDHMEGKIGGHCISENMSIVDDGFIKMMKILGERWIK